MFSPALNTYEAVRTKIALIEGLRASKKNELELAVRDTLGHPSDFAKVGKPKKTNKNLQGELGSKGSEELLPPRSTGDDEKGWNPAHRSGSRRRMSLHSGVHAARLTP